MIAVAIPGCGKIEHWADPRMVKECFPSEQGVHILSPFDPLVIQRKRLKLFFGYEHRFEAYVPREKRVFGYFALPILMDEEIVAAIDVKADRGSGTLLIQKWNWLREGSAASKARIEEALHRFEAFQFPS